MLKVLLVVISVTLVFLPGCTLKRSGSNNSANTGASNLNDLFIPPKIGDFTRSDTPKSAFINPDDAPNENRENLSSSYTIPSEEDKLAFSYIRNHDKDRLNWWIGQMLSKSTEDCKDLDPENLKAAQEQESHYKLVKRESKAGGEVIVMRKDPSSLCNKGQKNEYEKVYFIRGDILFVARRNNFKNYGAAEQFMNEFLKDTSKLYEYLDARTKK